MKPTELQTNWKQPYYWYLNRLLSNSNNRIWVIIFGAFARCVLLCKTQNIIKQTLCSLHSTTIPLQYNICNNYRICSVSEYNPRQLTCGNFHVTENSYLSCFQSYFVTNKICTPILCVTVSVASVWHFLNKFSPIRTQSMGVQILCLTMYFKTNWWDSVQLSSWAIYGGFRSWFLHHEFQSE